MQRITDSSSQSTHIKFENENTVNQNARAIATSILEDIIAGIPTRAASPLNERAAIGIPQDVLLKQVSDWLMREDCTLDYLSVVGQINDLDALHQVIYKFFKEKPIYDFATPRIINLLQELAKRGHAEATLSLGNLYACGCIDRVDLDVTFDFKKRDRDQKIAFELYQKGYQLGCKAALVEMGIAYRTGLGTEIDLHKGMKCLLEAEKHQVTAAYNSLGFCFELGRYGQKKDPVRAFSCYMNAHKSGADNLDGFRFCFEAMQTGLGAPKDLKAAREFIEKAHSEGNPLGTYFLGVQYTKGNPALGISQDIDKGIGLVEQAARLGCGTAIRYLYDVNSDEDCLGFNSEKAANYLKNGLGHYNEYIFRSWMDHNLDVRRYSMNTQIKEDISVCVKRYTDLCSVPSVKTFHVGSVFLELGYVKEAHQIYNRGFMSYTGEGYLDNGLRNEYHEAIARFNAEKKEVTTRLDALQAKTSASYDHFIAAIDHLIDLHSAPRVISRVRFRTDHVGDTENEQLEELKTRLTKELSNGIVLDQEITASVQKLKTIPNTSEKSFNEFKTKIQYFKDRPFSLNTETEKKLEKYEGSLAIILKMAQGYSQEKKIDGLVAKCQEEWNTQSTQIVQEARGKELDELVLSWHDKIHGQAMDKMTLLQENLSALKEGCSSKQQEIQKLKRLLEDYHQRAGEIQTLRSSNQDITSFVQEFNDQNHLFLTTLEPSISPSSGPDYKEMNEAFQKELKSMQAELKETQAQLETSERDAKNTQSRMIKRYDQEIGSLEAKLGLETDKNHRLVQELEPYRKMEREQQTTTSIPVLIERANHRIAELIGKGVTRVRDFKLEPVPRTITGEYVIKVYQALGFTYRPPGDHHNFDRGQGPGGHTKITATMHDPGREVDEPAVVQLLLNTLLSDLKL